MHFCLWDQHHGKVWRIHRRTRGGRDGKVMEWKTLYPDTSLHWGEWTLLLVTVIYLIIIIIIAIIPFSLKKSKLYSAVICKFFHCFLSIRLIKASPLSSHSNHFSYPEDHWTSKFWWIHSHNIPITSIKTKSYFK